MIFQSWIIIFKRYKVASGSDSLNFCLLLRKKGKYNICNFHHRAHETVTLVIRGPPAAQGSFFPLVTSETPENTPLSFSEAVAWRLGVIEAVPGPFLAGRRWNPFGCRAWGAHCRGDSHLQSPFAWVNSLQRPTQGLLCLFICTFKGCYITGLNEVFNGKDRSELLGLTGTIWDPDSWEVCVWNDGNQMSVPWEGGWIIQSSRCTLETQIVYKVLFCLICCICSLLNL